MAARSVDDSILCEAKRPTSKAALGIPRTKSGGTPLPLNTFRPSVERSLLCCWLDLLNTCVVVVEWCGVGGSGARVDRRDGLLVWVVRFAAAAAALTLLFMGLLLLLQICRRSDVCWPCRCRPDSRRFAFVMSVRLCVYHENVVGYAVSSTHTQKHSNLCLYKHYSRNERPDHRHRIASSIPSRKQAQHTRAKREATDLTATTCFLLIRRRYESLLGLVVLTFKGVPHRVQ